MLLHNSAPLADVLPCDTENRKSMREDTQDAAMSPNPAFPSPDRCGLKSFNPKM